MPLGVPGSSQRARRAAATRAVATVALLLLALPSVGGPSASRTNGAQAAPADVSFNRDVAPIIFGKCASCHRPNQAAPMPLLSYQQVRPWLQSIVRRVRAREMPPWLADRRFGQFRNDASLREDEIQTIVNWAAQGAPEGNKPAPAPPVFADGWNHPSRRPPDVVLEMPSGHEVPADGVLPSIFTFSRLPPALSNGDSFVEAVQLMPENTRVVHHASFSTRRLPPGVILGRGPAWPGGPTVDHVPIGIDPSIQSANSPVTSLAERFSTEGASHFAFYLPGNNGFVRYWPGVGKRIRPGDHFEWGVHYTTTGRVERDRERVGLWLQSSPPTHEVLTLRIGDFHIVNGREVVLPAGITTLPGHAAVVAVPGTCGGRPCMTDRSMIPPIPAGATNWKITAITPVRDDATLYLAYPHGHLRLTDMTYVVTYPDGREDVILSVPRFDFNWQLVYEWAAPIKVPAGSTIKVIGHYDNSAANRRNPAPGRDVQWSEQVWDEMFNGFLDLSFDAFDVRNEKSSSSVRVGAASADSSRPAGVEPASTLVTVVGCVEHGADGRWALDRASEPRESAILHADASEVEGAIRTPLGNRQFRLIGTADFGSADELVRQDERAAFTTVATANATGQLQPGRKVAVKALLVASTPPRLNLLSVQPTSQPCPSDRSPSNR